MEPTKFHDFPDEWVDDIARAIESASGEGVCARKEVVYELAREFIQRNRDVPIAYSDHRTHHPEDFMRTVIWDA